MLIPALACGALAALLLSLGAVLPVVRGAEPGFAAAGWLIALALLPIAVAAAAAGTGRRSLAAGVLAGAALLAPGRAVLDLQFAVDASTAVRPALYLAEDLSTPPPAAGLWLLLAGQAAAVLAGGLAVRAAGMRAAPVPAGAPGGVRPDAPDTSGGGPPGGGALRGSRFAVALSAAVLAACGTLMAPFASSDAYLPAGSAFEAPPVALTGHLVVAGALPLGTALLLTSALPVAFRRGGLVGTALAVAGLVVPDLLAGRSLAGTEPTAGPVLALVAAAGLAAVAAFPGGGAAGTGTAGSAGTGTPGPGTDTGAREVAVPGRRRLEVATGAAAVFTGVAAVVGALSPTVTTPAPLPTPESPARWLLLVAGVLTVLPALALFVRRTAAPVRPVLSCVWVAVPLAGAPVLETASTAAEAGSAAPGPGVVWTSLATAAALVTACASVVAGLLEREEARDATDAGPPDPQVGAEPGRSRLTAAGTRMVVPMGVALVLTAAAFFTPAVVAPDYVEPTLWPEPSAPLAGLMVARATVFGALVLAPVCRPARAAALLTGVACVLGLRAAAPLLLGLQLDDAGPGPGAWSASVAVPVVAWAAWLAVSARRTGRF